MAIPAVSFGIPEYMDKHGLNAGQFAKKVGVNQSTIWRFLNKHVAFRGDTIAKIIAGTNGEIKAENLIIQPSNRPRTRRAA